MYQSPEAIDELPEIDIPRPRFHPQQTTHLSCPHVYLKVLMYALQRQLCISGKVSVIEKDVKAQALQV